MDVAVIALRTDEWVHAIVGSETLQYVRPCLLLLMLGARSIQTSIPKRCSEVVYGEKASVHALRAAGAWYCIAVFPDPWSCPLS